MLRSKCFTLLVLLITLLETVAFRASESRKKWNDCFGTLFVFIGDQNGINEFMPGKYMAAPPGFQPEELPDQTTNCLGSDVVCAICVSQDQVYPSPNPSNPFYAGKPKVDAGNLKTAIAAATISPSLDGVAQLIGQDLIIVYLRTNPQ